MIDDVVGLATLAAMDLFRYIHFATASTRHTGIVHIHIVSPMTPAFGTMESPFPDLWTSDEDR